MRIRGVEGTVVDRLGLYGMWDGRSNPVSELLLPTHHLVLLIWSDFWTVEKLMNTKICFMWAKGNEPSRPTYGLPFTTSSVFGRHSMCQSSGG
jgi:hypothetical protein